MSTNYYDPLPQYKKCINSINNTKSLGKIYWRRGFQITVLNILILPLEFPFKICWLFRFNTQRTKICPHSVHAIMSFVIPNFSIQVTVAEESWSPKVWIFLSTKKYFRSSDFELIHLKFFLLAHFYLFYDSNTLRVWNSFVICYFSMEVLYFSNFCMCWVTFLFCTFYHIYM